MKIYIKNMACESCKFVVQKAFEELNIALLKIDLGEVDTKTDVTHDQKIELNNKIRQVGLEVLENKQGVLIEKIRRVILDYVYKIEDRPVVKFSVYLSKELDHSYTYLSNFFLKLRQQRSNNILSV